jgi:subtilisin family serine protease
MSRVLSFFILLFFLSSSLTLFGTSKISEPLNKLDPTLRYLLAQQRLALVKTGRPMNLSRYADRIEVIASDGKMLPSASLGSSADRIAVLIRAQNPEELRTLGIVPRAIVGEIATAHVTLAQLSKLAQSPNVIYAEVSKRLSLEQTASQPQIANPALDLSMPDTGAILLHQQGITGRGVIVAVIDTGIDCTHKDFRVERYWSDNIDEESTRLLALLDQTTNTEYGPTRIENFIRSEMPCPTGDEDLTASGHGSQVMGVAAGDGSSTPDSYVGMAPEADLIAVKSNLSDAGIIEAARYVFERAGGRPTVINLSVGTQKGPHDGTSNLELGLDGLVGPPGRAIVVAAGNQGDEKVHVGGVLYEGKRDRFEITINEQQVPSEMSFDFWYESQLNLNVYVVTPVGNRVGPVATRRMHTENTSEGGVRIDNASTGLSPNNGANHMEITIYGIPIAVASGTWTIEVEGTGSGGGRYDGWSTDVQFSSINANADVTIGSPGSSKRLITVGAYVTREQWQSVTGDFFSFPKENPVGQIASFSSNGPTRDRRAKPDITAPGTAIATTLSEAARYMISKDFILLDNKHTIVRGTSFSAPHVTGAIALMLQQEPNLTITQIRERLVKLAKQDSYTGVTPNTTWGVGKLWVSTATKPDPDPDPNPKPISEQLKLLVRQFDQNRNNQLDDEEMLAALDDWINSRDVYVLSRALKDEEILNLLDLWQHGIPS